MYFFFVKKQEQYIQEFPVFRVGKAYNSSHTIPIESLNPPIYRGKTRPKPAHRTFNEKTSDSLCHS